MAYALNYFYGRARPDTGVEVIDALARPESDRARKSEPAHGCETRSRCLAWFSAEGVCRSQDQGKQSLPPILGPKPRGLSRQRA